ncbi:DNA phosphorothioation-associated DGQHR protein 1 [Brucella pseudogrignonensis]|uniref:DGQHR domain-containing protein n=1 Tax=Brucella pseudogrignonensis TaxID=419475 RepID=UPI0007DA6051|nr:DGQHR domain-containing protein [Brucella pseudogrignonensis]ANG98810.1 DNA phosphorothioation-associated DGQHR protein 1 [Brucella pseudogrignonensis]
MTKFPYETPAILVEQPLGSFYITKLPARLLLQVGFSDVLRASHTDNPSRPYHLDGTQREQQSKRLLQIGQYIDRDDSAFPNAIILAANIRPEDGLIEEAPEDEEGLADLPGASDAETATARNTTRVDRRWKIRDDSNGCSWLTIPTAAQLAAVIDGQHRLWGFTFAEVVERLDMDLSCAIYMDLPKPFQAQLFATINSNQKRVDKSLTYELFGYNIEDEEPEYWAPDKLAVYLTRRLGADKDSVLKGRISIAPRKDEVLAQQHNSQSWKVSTAVIVDGILRLISSNPKSDANAMLTPVRSTRATLEGDGSRRDRSPLRSAFLGREDAVIYQMVKNFLFACNEVFWMRAEPNSFITRTIGIQAQFDILRQLATEAYETKIISTASFRERLENAGNLDFSEDVYRNASGSGRSLIRRAIEARIGLGRN